MLTRDQHVENARQKVLDWSLQSPIEHKVKLLVFTKHWVTNKM